MACRLTEDGKTKSIHRLHPVEIFRMNLWDVSRFCKPRIPENADKVTFDSLNEMAGNMWSGYHVVPIIMASFGAVSWTQVEDATARMVVEESKQSQGQVNVSSAEGTPVSDDSD
eukprot:9471266-Pyramimonas_sp.AAC.1